MPRSTFQITPAQRDFLRQLAYVSDRPMRAVLDDALLLLEALTACQSESADERDDADYRPLLATAERLQERYNGR